METTKISPNIELQNNVSHSAKYSAGWLMTLLLIIGDAVILIVSLIMAIITRILVLGEIEGLAYYWKVTPILCIFFLIAFWQGLYKTGGNSPVRELRLLTVSVFITFLFLATFTFFTQTGMFISRFVILVAWGLAIIALPLERWGLRTLTAHLGLWGEPLIILGAGSSVHAVLKVLSQQKYLGLLPVGVVTSHYSDKVGNLPLPLKFFESPEGILHYMQTTGVKTIFVIPGELPSSWILQIIDSPESVVRRAFFLSDLNELGYLDVHPYDFNGMLGLEFRQHLLSPWGRFLKRSLGLLITAVSSIFALPLGIIIAFLIKLDSKGPILYCQERVGYCGRPFKLWKFRTMVQDAEEMLDDCLEINPELQAEWNSNQKLKYDPRITRIGNVLRKFSLDELPQFINVFRGEMALIGPRPIVEAEVEKYSDNYWIFSRVKPGITGLWQVSGRNETTYDERVQLDKYYVHNWSIWLDIYIVARTAWTMLKRNGAY